MKAVRKLRVVTAETFEILLDTPIIGSVGMLNNRTGSCPDVGQGMHQGRR
jgi:hypothetical protein